MSTRTSIRYTILLPTTESNEPSSGPNPRAEAAVTLVQRLMDRFPGGTVYQASGGGPVLSGWWKDEPTEPGTATKTYVDNHLRVDIDIALKNDLKGTIEREQHVDEIVQQFRTIYAGRIREKAIYVYTSELMVHNRLGKERRVISRPVAPVAK